VVPSLTQLKVAFSTPRSVTKLLFSTGKDQWKKNKDNVLNQDKLLLAYLGWALAHDGAKHGLLTK
jgi:hypothetical protein